jgi:hypothetical protein
MDTLQRFKTSKRHGWTLCNATKPPNATDGHFAALQNFQTAWMDTLQRCRTSKRHGWTLCSAAEPPNAMDGHFAALQSHPQDMQMVIVATNSQFTIRNSRLIRLRNWK